MYDEISFNKRRHVMDRQEIREHMIQALRDHFTSAQFEPGEFDVHSNDNAGTVTIIDRVSNRAMELTDTSFQVKAWTGQARS